MATSTTTAQLIREQQQTQLHGLRCTQDRHVVFQSYKRGEDFRQWAEDNPSACYRRFSISDLATYETPTISDGLIEEVQTQFQIVVSYPKDTRYGGDGTYGLQDIIRNDHRRIEATLGINGYGQYLAGHQLCQLSSFEVEEGEGVWFGVGTYDVIFYQAVDSGTLYISASISCTATVVATPEPFTVSASVSATATVAVTSSLVLGGYTLATLTPAAIASITGQAAPTYMWLGSDASGATELVSGTDNLTDVDSPSKQVNNATLNGLTTQMIDSADSMDAASSTVLDVGLQTLTIMAIFLPTSWIAGQVVGKRESAGSNLGYEMLGTATTERLEWRVDTASGVVTRVIGSAHGTTNAQVVVATKQVAADMQGIWSREGSSTGTRNNETMANSQTFSVASGRTPALPGYYAAVMAWVGTDGDFGDAAAFESARSAVAVALGYE